MSKQQPQFIRTTLWCAALICSLGAQAQLRTATTPLRTLSATASLPTDTRADYIVAIVNSEPVTYRDVMRQLVRFEQQLTRQGVALPPREVLAKQVLEKLIDDRVLVQEAKEAGIKIDAATLDEAVVDIAKQNNISVPQLYKQLESEGVDKDRFRQDIREEMLVNRLRERDFEARIRISDTEIEERISEEHSQSAESQVEINLAQILIAVPEQASEGLVQQLREKAESIRASLANGVDFDKLCRENSSAPNKDAGGVMGLRPLNRYPESFVEATASLPTGGISSVVQSGAGFHILRLIEKKSAGLPSMSVLQTSSRHILLLAQPQKSTDELRRELTAIRTSILSGELRFEDAARKFSADGSANTGGDLGWASPGQFVPEFESVMNRLPQGSISEPFVSRYGIHIVQVLGRRKQTVSQTEYKNMVRQALKEKKIQERMPQWVRDLRTNAYVEYRQAPEL
jgi:peptidyl-prolyl cis-trans isomerase SurA